VSHQGSETVEVKTLDKYTGKVLEVKVEPGEPLSISLSLVRTSGWYDVVMTVDSDPGFEYRLAGHLETGQDSISDPALGALV
jgi:phospholipase C